MGFLKRHWKILLITAAAIAAALVVIFCPPAALGFLMIGLASAPAFAGLGAGAIIAVTALTAAGAAAATYIAGGLLVGLSKFVGWMVDKFRPKHIPGAGDEPGDAPASTDDVVDADADAAAARLDSPSTMAAGLGARQSNPADIDLTGTTPPGDQQHHQSPLAAVVGDGGTHQLATAPALGDVLSASV